jgi:hypothetical protein
MMRSRRILLAVVALAAAFVVSAGTAFAYWATTGTGTGSATAGTVTISVTAQPAGPALVPGGSSDVTAVVGSASGYPLVVTAIVAGPVTASCTAPDVTFTPVTILPTIADGAVSYRLGTASMGTDASSDCQGKAITIPLTVTVKK